MDQQEVNDRLKAVLRKTDEAKKAAEKLSNDLAAAETAGREAALADFPTIIKNIESEAARDPRARRACLIASTQHTFGIFAERAYYNAYLKYVKEQLPVEFSLDMGNVTGGTPMGTTYKIYW